MGSSPRRPGSGSASTSPWIAASTSRRAGASDDVAWTVSYADLTEIVVEIATQRRFALIEALAEAIAESCLTRFSRLRAVTVRVDKPSAPVPAVIDGVSIEITRRQATRTGRSLATGQAGA